MNNKQKVEMRRRNIWIAKEADMKAQMLAASMGISVSHLIEGLIMGAQIVSGKSKN